MRRYGSLIAVLILTTACGGTGSVPSHPDLGSQTPNDATALGDRSAGDGSCPAPTTDFLHVDPSAVASTAANGSSACPFKTITAALAVAPSFFAPAGGSGGILLAPGTYDAAHGETFPLDVPYGIDVEGDPTRSTSPDAFVIDGSGVDAITGKAHTVVLGGILGNLVATDSSHAADAIVYVVGGCHATGAPGAQITAKIAGGQTAAIEVLGQPSLACANTLDVEIPSEITGSAGFGVLVGPGGGGVSPAATIFGARIHDNGGNGVDVAGTFSTPPNVRVAYSCVIGNVNMNVIYCNGKAGIAAAAGTTVEACGNEWNHNPPTTSGTGIDYQGTVDVTAYGTAATGACP
jgi:hypothetical protein